MNSNAEDENIKVRILQGYHCIFGVNATDILDIGRLLRVLSASCIITEMTLDMFEPTDYSLALGDANAYEHHLIGWR